MTYADDIGLPSFGLMAEIIFPLLIGCFVIGFMTWYNLEKKKKNTKKLSKAQKRKEEGV